MKYTCVVSFLGVALHFPWIPRSSRGMTNSRDPSPRDLIAGSRKKSKNKSVLIYFFRKGLVFLMQGLGVGYSPIVPGTFGTLLAIPLYLALSHLPFWLYSLVVLILFVVGVYGCRVALSELKVPDPPGLVWDEVVGFLVTMTAIAPNLKMVLIGFVLFRLFDIVKPWPVRWVDKNMGGGLGIMLDDVLAGVYANLILQLFLSIR